MKFITSLLSKTFLVIFSLSVFSCSVEPIGIEETANAEIENFTSLTCSGEQPEARFTNNGSVDFTFTILSSESGQVAEFINVAPGSSTAWTSFDSGEVLFSISSDVTGVSDMKTLVFMENCESYNVEVQFDNTLVDNTPVGS